MNWIVNWIQSRSVVFGIDHLIQFLHAMKNGCRQRFWCCCLCYSKVKTILKMSFNYFQTSWARSVEVNNTIFHLSYFSLAFFFFLSLSRSRALFKLDYSTAYCISLSPDGMCVYIASFNSIWFIRFVYCLRFHSNIFIVE